MTRSEIRARRAKKRKIQRIKRIVAIAAAVALFATISAVTFASCKGGETEEKAVETKKPLALVNTPSEADFEEVKTEENTEADSEISETDQNLLLKLAMAEAEGESLEGKAMVMRVALNRVESKDFPDNLHDVIFQKCGDTYQFSPVQQDGRWWSTEPNEDCEYALDLILAGWDKSEGALYFEAVTNGTDTWHTHNLEFIKRVGNHNFYK